MSNPDKQNRQNHLHELHNKSLHNPCSVRYLLPKKFDLRLPEHLADGWDADCPQIKVGDGYDHNWALNGAGYRKVAALASGESQITLTVWTDQPGMQVYTANGLTDRPGKGGARYGRRCSVALETQAFPDAVHHENFPSVVLRAGEVYRTKTAFAFS